MKSSHCAFALIFFSLGIAGTAAAQTRRPTPGKPAVKGRPASKVAAPPAPIESAKRIDNSAEDGKEPLIINKVKIKDPVLVFYQQTAPPMQCSSC
ncbi:hypothetical protein [Hymenobacter sp. BRD67]|uniref:hypothetical protein n=1 Tax=Hymenobacter sp. BRD67 TaxID=2675877 RepID=UPI0015663136|nr:hypothetical protein [Hymenobacter sp. BRD67]QKG52011.1 hypothetical protein GKZ67_04565 [Hymenobacter sp. BRD67]